MAREGCRLNLGDLITSAYDVAAELRRGWSDDEVALFAAWMIEAVTDPGPPVALSWGVLRGGDGWCCFVVGVA